MVKKYAAPPKSPEQQRDRLCYLLGYARQLSVDGLGERWHRRSAHDPAKQLMTWEERCATLAGLASEVRLIINNGADRWLHAALGTRLGEWTSDLWLTLAGLAQEMLDIDPADVTDRTMEEDVIAEKVTELAQRYAQLQAVDFDCTSTQGAFAD